jgi:translation initiation factor 3 subunit L
VLADLERRYLERLTMYGGGVGGVGGDYDDYDEYGDFGTGGHTGDPALDREIYERQQSAFQVPDQIKRFVSYFKDMISESNSLEIQNLYENAWPKLTEQYFKTAAWPDAEEISGLVQDDELFIILYKELYYRHIYARVQGGPTIDHRFESYYNYCNLFNYILSSDTPVGLELPNQWLWEIVDEFIYQFQSFQQYRAKMSKKSDDEREMLQQNTRVWDVLQVLNVLHSMVDKSNINKQLEVYTAGGNPDTVAGEFGRVPLYKMMGYFSLVGLLRLHSLLGDYYQAIKVLENIQLNKKSLYARVPGCQITMYYYVGFAYMMMRRYADAIRTFSNILLYIQRTKGLFQTKTYQNDQINKQTDQMYVLLAMCLVLHPQRIDESLHSMLKEKNFTEKMNKMQSGDLQEFEASFSFACPKFLSPVPPDYSMSGGGAGGMNDPSHKEPLRLQLKVFMDEVQQQKMLPTVRSFLKLYTSMPIVKLADYMNDMKVDDLENILLCFKHKMRNIVWTKGTSGLDGEFQSESEVDFYIDKNMIHIADTKVDRRYGDFFIRQIHKFEELNRGLKTLKMD